MHESFIVAHARLRGFNGNRYDQMRGVDFANLPPIKQEPLATLSRIVSEMKSLCDWQDSELGKAIWGGWSQKKGATLETAMERYEKIVSLYTFWYKAINLLFLWITSEHDLPVGKVTSKISSDEIFWVTKPQETRGGIDRPQGDHIDGRKWSDPTNGLALPIAPGFDSCTGWVERQKTTEWLKGNNLTK